MEVTGDLEALMATASDEVLHYFATDCAERTLIRGISQGREPDERSWKAVEVKRLWLRGECSDEELEAAWVAALVAARSAAWSPAWSSAWAAAWVAARDAAWDAAIDAVRAAAWSAARDAAWYAAREAVWSTAWNDAWAAAKAVEGKWQLQRLKYLIEVEKINCCMPLVYTEPYTLLIPRVEITPEEPIPCHNNTLK